MSRGQQRQFARSLGVWLRYVSQSVLRKLRKNITLNHHLFDRILGKNSQISSEKTVTWPDLTWPVTLLQVSWGRSRSVKMEVLTSGETVFAGDGRFEPIHQPRTEHWALRVRNVQLQDAGRYFCQVGTTPQINHYIHLTVVGELLHLLLCPESRMFWKVDSTHICILNAPRTGW